MGGERKFVHGIARGLHAVSRRGIGWSSYTAHPLRAAGRLLSIPRRRLVRGREGRTRHPYSCYSRPRLRHVHGPMVATRADDVVLQPRDHKRSVWLVRKRGDDQPAVQDAERAARRCPARDATTPLPTCSSPSRISLRRGERLVARDAYVRGRPVPLRGAVRTREQWDGCGARRLVPIRRRLGEPEERPGRAGGDEILPRLEDDDPSS